MMTITKPRSISTEERRDRPLSDSPNKFAPLAGAFKLCVARFVILIRDYKRFRHRAKEFASLILMRKPPEQLFAESQTAFIVLKMKETAQGIRDPICGMEVDPKDSAATVEARE